MGHKPLLMNIHQQTAPAIRNLGLGLRLPLPNPQRQPSPGNPEAEGTESAPQWGQRAWPRGGVSFVSTRCW